MTTIHIYNQYPFTVCKSKRDRKDIGLFLFEFIPNYVNGKYNTNNICNMCLNHSHTQMKILAETEL